MSTPPGHELSDAVAALRRRLTPDQLAAVQDRLRGGPAAGPPTQAAVSTVPAAGQPDVPLSFAQRRLWYLERSLELSPRYTIATAFDVAGPLDISALRAAAKTVLDRHAALRTTIVDRAGTPVGVLAAASELSVRTHNIGPDVDVGAALRNAAAQPFDVTVDPLFRIDVFSSRRDRHSLLLCIHHLVADAWSVELILTDLSLGYRAALSHSTVEFAPIQLTYADYALRQQESLDSDLAARMLAFWVAELRDAPLVLNLPTRHPRPSRQRGRGAEVRRPLPVGLSRASAALAQEQRTTVFTVLLTAFAAVLQRYSGQDDLVVGIPVAGRSRPGLERVVGLFVNTLPIRIKLFGEPSFRELVGRVREAVLRGLAHQDVPFERIVQEVRPHRSTDRSPIFQVLADLQHPVDLTLERTRVTQRHLDARTSKFDLHCSFVQRSVTDIESVINYDSDLFDAPSAELLLGHLHQVLEEALVNLDRPVWNANMLSPTEREEFAATDRTDTDLSTWAGLERTVDLCARRSPMRTAISFAGTDTDYQSMCERSHRLADWLRAEGVAPQAVVGVSAQRSTEIVIALLAVLRVGATFLPLDPEDPPERLRGLVAETGARLILTPPGGTDRFVDVGVPVHSVCGPEIDCREGEQGASNDCAADPDHLAYIMYTSGSSGKPKGVMVSRRALANRIAWVATAHRLTEGDAVLSKTPLTFDVALGEIFWPLMSGARLVMAEPGLHRDPAGIAVLVARERVTVAHFVPSMLQPFLDHLQTSGCTDLDGLRRIFCSGEALGPELVAGVRQLLPHAALYNLYGPTEATIEVSSWSCGELDRESVPIGRPAPNCRMYVLDERLRRMPIGLPGDLFLAGVQLARGYLEQPALTAHSFLPDPFAADPGQRMYRTGDRAVIRPDGAIEFLGRSDRQVKIRGYRIELGEIEAALRRCRGVAQAAVIVRKHSPQKGRADRRIVAFLVPDKRPQPTTALVREQLRGRLPAYMVPTTITWCERLTLTASGKLDYAALPLTDLPPEGPQGPESAATETVDDGERRIASVLADTLGVHDLAVSADFFDAGGHSLLALTALGRLADELGITVALRDFLTDPTARGLAAIHRHHRVEEIVLQADRSIGGLRFGEAPAGRPILVTGGTGMIGSFVVQELIRRGHRVRLLCRKSVADVPLNATVEVAAGDLSDAASLLGATSGTAGIVHLAWSFEGADQPNVPATRSLVEAWAAGATSGTFVFVSTVDVYGRPQRLPVAEDDPVDPLYSEYGRAKILSEEIVRTTAARHGRSDFTILRPPYVWGPHPYCRWQLRVAAGHYFYEAVRTGAPIVVPDRNETSDVSGHGWVDARELAGVIVECVERPSGSALNVVNDHFSWSDFYAQLSALSGHHPTVEFGAAVDDFHAVPRRFSTNRLHQHLGFRPIYRWRDTLAEVFGDYRGAGSTVWDTGKVHGRR